MRRILALIADYIRECNKTLFILCLSASLFSCIAVLSCTLKTTGSIKQFLTQFIGMMLGITAVIVISSFDYKTIGKRWYIFAAIALLLVVLTFFFGYAPGETDDKAWLALPGGISFQPSELLKIVFALTFGIHCEKIGEEGIYKFKNLFFLLVHGAIPIGLIHLQGDDGSALIFAFMFIGMMFVAGVKLRYFIIAFAGIATASPFVYLLVMNDDQRDRIAALFNSNPSEDDIRGILYQQWQSKTALANGGFLGKGLFKGPLVQSGQIPEGHNDFIFSSIGEEAGLLGCLIVIILLCAIMIKILMIGKNARDKMGTVICAGIFFMLLAQAAVNIGMCLSVLPVIGVTLPFFSAGGTSLLCTYLGIGLVMSVYMHRNTGLLYLHDDF